MSAELIQDLSQDGIRPKSGAQFGQWRVQGSGCPRTLYPKNVNLRSTVGRYCSSGRCSGYKTIYAIEYKFSSLVHSSKETNNLFADDY